MTLARGYLTIIVRASTRAKAHPLTAYLGGTPIEGCGRTVAEAIEDLLSSEEAGEVCARLEREVTRCVGA